MQQKMIQFSGDVSLPAIGQGTWYMGEDASQRKTEVAALRAGIELGLTLIDTAEMYADGGAEMVVGEALTGLRENVFLVSKVYPWNAGGQKAINACEASLRRLNTDYLDLYLLHWSGSFAFEETVAAMEKLIAQSTDAYLSDITHVKVGMQGRGGFKFAVCFKIDFTGFTHAEMR